MVHTIVYEIKELLFKNSSKGASYNVRGGRDELRAKRGGGSPDNRMEKRYLSNSRGKMCTTRNSLNFFENSSFSNSFYFFVFFRKTCLFLKNEINNPSSNFIWNKVQSISIERHQEQSIFMFYVALNTAESSEKATARIVGKGGNVFKKT